MTPESNRVIEGLEALLSQCNQNEAASVGTLRLRLTEPIILQCLREALKMDSYDEVLKLQKRDLSDLQETRRSLQLQLTEVDGELRSLRNAVDENAASCKRIGQTMADQAQSIERVTNMAETEAHERETSVQILREQVEPLGVRVAELAEQSAVYRSRLQSNSTSAEKHRQEILTLQLNIGEIGKWTRAQPQGLARFFKPIPRLALVESPAEESSPPASSHRSALRADEVQSNGKASAPGDGASDDRESHNPAPSPTPPASVLLEQLSPPIHHLPVPDGHDERRRRILDELPKQFKYQKGRRDSYKKKLTDNVWALSTSVRFDDFREAARNSYLRDVAVDKKDYQDRVDSWFNQNRETI